MTRSVVETVVRNPETGEEKVLRGNYSVVAQHRDGFTEVKSQTVEKYVLSDDEFFKYAKKIEK